MTSGVKAFADATIDDLVRSGIMQMLDDIGVTQYCLWMGLISLSSKKLAESWEVELSKQEIAAVIKSAVISELCFEHSDHVKKISISEENELVFVMTDSLYWYVTSLSTEIDELLIGSNRMQPLWS